MTLASHNLRVKGRASLSLRYPRTGALSARSHANTCTLRISQELYSRHPACCI